MSFCTNANALCLDSIAIVQLNDSVYGLAVYGLNPTTPCEIIDSTKNISGNTIEVSLCYIANGSQGTPCNAYDTVYLGALNSTAYTVSLALSIADNISYTCQTTTARDTFTFFYSSTGIYETGSTALLLFPNPSNNYITVSRNSGKPATAYIYFSDGQMALPATPLNNNATSISTTTLLPGIYLMVIDDGENRLWRRFSKL